MKITSLFISVLSVLALSFASPATAIETEAGQAFMIDMETGNVLLNKNGDERMPPSSMSKLMTTYVLFSKLKNGELKLDDTFMVSEKAWRMKGSKTFVPLGEPISIEDLIHGIVIQSGNDACIVVAEGISGTEEGFADLLNQTATDIGMTGSHFVNASGWPDENHYVTSRDLALLAKRLIEDFPEYYHYFAKPEYTYNNIKQYNRNLLLKGDVGVDGLKTGHTEAAGYGITLSAKKGDRRLILVINGMTSEKQRAEEGEKLLRWGFREFTNKKLASAGQEVAKANVWFGSKLTVPLVISEDLVLTLPASTNQDISYVLRYTGPIPAPIEKGSQIAELVISVGDKEEVIPLTAGESIAKLSGFDYALAKLKYSIIGHR
ncbi:MAG: D-alanyl-D-alanine carboxypeptidase family protein [Rickettsiales bacterium]